MSRKAAKRKPGGMGGGANHPPRNDITIVLEDNKLPSEFDPIAHKNIGSGIADRVRWDNQSSRGRTVRFDLDWWPFVEPPEEIPIQKGRKSAWFTVYAGAPDASYTYKVSPPLVYGTGPDEPKIVVEG